MISLVQLLHAFSLRVLTPFGPTGFLQYLPIAAGLTCLSAFAVDRRGVMRYELVNIEYVFVY